MPFRKCLMGRSSRGPMAAMLLAAWAPASHAALRPPGLPETALAVRYEAGSGETRVLRTVSPDLCFSLVLPQRWRPTAGEGMRTVLSSAAGAELDVYVRSAREVAGRPEPDLASRDAALLQRDRETALGRPAQAVSLVSLTPGSEVPEAKRWTATWIDANLPADAQTMTVETFIVPLSNDWLLELSLSNVRSRTAYEALARTLLAELRPLEGSECRGRGG